MPKTPAPPCTVQIPVWLSVEKGKVVATPDPVHIRAGQNEEVMWRSAEGVVDIKFKRGYSPFRRLDFHIPEGCGLTSGLPEVPKIRTGRKKGTRSNPQYRFDYGVVIKSRRGRFETDPGLVVDC